MSDAETIREALEWARDHLEELWREGRTNQTLHAEPALTSLARLERAEEALRWADDFLAHLDDEGARAVRRVIAAAGEENER